MTSSIKLWFCVHYTECTVLGNVKADCLRAETVCSLVAEWLPSIQRPWSRFSAQRTIKYTVYCFSALIKFKAFWMPPWIYSQHLQRTTGTTNLLRMNSFEDISPHLDTHCFQPSRPLRANLSSLWTIYSEATLFSLRPVSKQMAHSFPKVIRTLTPHTDSSVPPVVMPSFTT